MIHKTKHYLYSNIMHRKVFRRYEDRGKLNRAWNKGSITIHDVIYLAYRLNKQWLNTTN